MDRLELMRRCKAVVLAAGESSRMGLPKLNMPWGNSTVLGKVINTLVEAGLTEIVVVAGASPLLIHENLQDSSLKMVENPNAKTGEMLSSLKAGLLALDPIDEAALVVLGDQPQIEVDVVRKLLEVFLTVGAPLVVPSYHMRRGHPWLLAQSLWSEILNLQAPATLRQFLNEYQNHIHYLEVDTPSVLQDLDTPNDYRKFRPG